MGTEFTVQTLKEHLEQRLTANERAVEAAFKASEKAIDKAEAAQSAYNTRSNEFRAALDDQNKTMLPRIEADNRFQQLRELIEAQGKQIVALQRSDSQGEGATDAKTTAKTNSQWIIALIIATVLSLLGLIWAVMSRK